MLGAMIPTPGAKRKPSAAAFAAAVSSRRARIRAARPRLLGLCSQGPWSSPLWDSGWMLDESGFIRIACSSPSMVPNRLHLLQIHRIAWRCAGELQAEVVWFEKALDLDLTRIVGLEGARC